MAVTTAAGRNASCISRLLLNSQYLRSRSVAGRRQLQQASWIMPSASKKDRPVTKLDIEKLFTNAKVQELLAEVSSRISHVEPEKTFYEARDLSSNAMPPKEPEYQLMTEEELEEVYRKHVFFKEALSEKPHVLDTDASLIGHDTSNYVFTDISPTASHQDRTVVVRETDGTLRTALPHEHSRLIRTYYGYEKPFYHIEYPQMFYEPAITDALDSRKHVYLLDTACTFFEPNQPDYVRILCRIFEHVDTNQLHDLLWSTRHFAALSFYLTLNLKNRNLLLYCAQKKRTHEMACLIRLVCAMHPNRLDKQLAAKLIGNEDQDEKLIQDYVNAVFAKDHDLKQRVLALNEPDNQARSSANHRTARQ